MPYRGGVRLSGAVLAVDGEIEPDILRLDAGRTEEIYVKTTTARGSGGAARFVTVVDDLRRNTRIIVRTHPTARYLAGNGIVRVKVRASVGLSAVRLATGARLTVKVLPTAAGGTVTLEKRVDGRWLVVRTAPRAPGQTVTFRVGRGTHVLRARFIEGDICAEGVSRTLTLRVD